MAIYDLATGKTVQHYHRPERKIVHVAWSGNARFLSYGDATGEIFLWDLANNTHSSVLRQVGELNSLTFEPDSNRLASTGHDGLIQFWDLSDKVKSKLDDFVQGRPRLGFRIAWHPNANQIAVFDRTSSKIEIWDFSEHLLVSEFSTGAHFNASLAWHPNGSRLLVGKADGAVSLWDTESQQMVMRLQGHTRPVLDVAWSSDGKRFATASEDFNVRIWNADYSYRAASDHE